MAKVSSPVSRIAVNHEALGSFYWQPSKSSLWYFLTSLASALFSALVMVDFPLLYEDAQGGHQPQYLTKAISKYTGPLSGEELNLVCGEAGCTMRLDHEAGKRLSFIPVCVKIAFHRVGWGVALTCKLYLGTEFLMASYFISGL